MPEEGPLIAGVPVPSLHVPPPPPPPPLPPVPVPVSQPEVVPRVPEDCGFFDELARQPRGPKLYRRGNVQPMCLVHDGGAPGLGCIFVGGWEEGQDAQKLAGAGVGVVVSVL